MQKIGKCWVDENNNSWNCEYYSESQAAELSATMVNCRDCRYCRNCSNCSDCSDCCDCSDCSNCCDCSDCSNCRDFNHQPEIYQSKNIGSRNAITYAYYYEGYVYIACGCFRGDLADFEEAVQETHGDNEHGVEYAKLIERIKMIFKED